MGHHGRGQLPLIPSAFDKVYIADIYQMSDYFKSKNPAPEGALMPASHDEVMKKFQESA